MLVRATQRCFYGNVLREIGSVFEFDLPAKAKLPGYVERAPESLSPAEKAKLAKDEAVARAAEAETHAKKLLAEADKAAQLESAAKVDAELNPLD